MRSSCMVAVMKDGGSEPHAIAGSAGSREAPQLRREHLRRVLGLPGGGALGSYQAGAYAALCAHDFEPDWIAGISIGAINAAIIAGNSPELRVPRLKEFWELVSSASPWTPKVTNDHGRLLLNELSAA